MIKFTTALLKKLCLGESRKIKQSEASKTEEGNLQLSDDELQAGSNYFFRKATLEWTHFVKLSKFKNITKEKNGILYYTGRIMPTDQVNVVGKLTSVMKDLNL